MSTFKKQVLSTISSLDLDLKGYTMIQAVEFITESFENSRELDEMIRISLTVGAGKEKRQKYDEDLPKWVMNTLKSIGFEESRSADLSFGSSGNFKYQHDTNKNLKFIHVYPKAVQKRSDEENATIDLETSSPEGFTPLEWTLVICRVEEFKKQLLAAPTWTLKKRIKEFLRKTQDKLTSAEEKLSKMKLLDEAEQFLYSEAVDLSEKAKHTVSEMKSHVTDGDLTAKEKAALISAAKDAENNERVKVLEEIPDKSVFQLKRGLFKNQVGLEKACKISVALTSLEKRAGAKGLWSSKLSPTEVSKLKQKMEADETIKEILVDELWLFETEAELETRVNELKHIISQALSKKSKVRQETGLNNNDNWNFTKVKPRKPDFSKGIKKPPNTGRFQGFM